MILSTWSRLLINIVTNENFLRWLVGILISLLFSAGAYFVRANNVRSERIEIRQDEQEKFLRDRLEQMEVRLARIEEKIDILMQRK
jgi:hypothetical protein